MTDDRELTKVQVSYTITAETIAVLLFAAERVSDTKQSVEAAALTLLGHAVAACAALGLDDIEAVVANMVETQREIIGEMRAALSAANGAIEVVHMDATTTTAQDDRGGS